MRIVSTLLFLHISSAYLFCQTNRLYFRPTVEIRTYISHSDPNNPLPVPYFNYQIDHLGMIGGFELGFIAGYRFNKERMTIESGVKSSMIASGSHITLLGYGVDPFDSTTVYYNSYHFGESGGSSGTKIPISFSIQIKKWKVHLYKPTPFAIHCHLMGGVVFYHQRTTYLGEMNLGDRTLRINPTTTLHAVPSTHVLTANAILYKAGFTFDLRKKEREWFTITLYYMYGFRALSSERMDITITDIPSKTVLSRYRYNSYSKGDGILLEVSKRIFFQHR